MIIIMNTFIVKVKSDRDAKILFVKGASQKFTNCDAYELIIGSRNRFTVRHLAMMHASSCRNTL